DLLSRLRRSVSARAVFAVSALIASQTPGWLSAIGSTTGAGLFRCVSASATATPALWALAWTGAVGGGTGPLVAAGRGAGTGGGGGGAGMLGRGAIDADAGPVDVPRAATESCGISTSGGGGIGVCVNLSSASANCAGVW